MGLGGGGRRLEERRLQQRIALAEGRDTVTSAALHRDAPKGTVRPCAEASRPAAQL